MPRLVIEIDPVLKEEFRLARFFDGDKKVKEALVEMIKSYVQESKVKRNKKK